jgi:spoIIIJ-associated protein
VSEPVSVEATGETVAEARWAALHELERRYPSLDRDAVEFQVLSEGERGVLGVGYEPVRVVAVLTDVPEAAEPPVDEPLTPAAAEVGMTGPETPTSASDRLTAMLEQVVPAIAVDAHVRIVQRGSELEATITGDDLGLVIGRHGQTIDAIQYLANAMMHRHGEQVEVVIDAQGYRERRERMLHDVAVNAAVEARTTGQPVALEPMTSVERKIVHLRLKEFEGVGTESEGSEPNRHVVVIAVPEPDSDEV